MTRPISQAIKAHPFLGLFLLALAVRVLVVLVSGPLEAWALDDTTYLLLATQAAQDKRYLWDAYSVLLYEKTLGFSGPLTLLFRVFGAKEVVGQLYVATVGAALAPVVARIARERLPLSGALTAGLIMALLPSQIVWSSFVMKDTSVWLALAGMAALILLITRATGMPLVLAAAGLAITMFTLGYLREHTLVVATVAMLVCGAIGWRWWGTHRAILLVSLAVAVPWVVGLGPAGWTLITNAGSLEARRLANAELAQTAFVEDADPEQLEEVARLEEEAAAAASSVLTLEEKLAQVIARLKRYEAALPDAPPSEREFLQAQIDRLLLRKEELTRLLNGERVRAEKIRERVETVSPKETSDGLLGPDLMHLPRGIFVMLLEPTPWGWQADDSASLKVARLESVVWYPLLILACFGLPAAWRLRRSYAFPLLAAGGVLLVYALTEGNIGTAYRHRGEFVWTIALLAALGVTRLVRGREATVPDGTSDR